MTRAPPGAPCKFFLMEAAVIATAVAAAAGAARGCLFANWSDSRDQRFIISALASAVHSDASGVPRRNAQL